MQDLRRSFCALERHPSLHGLVVSAAVSEDLTRWSLPTRSSRTEGFST